jgi:sugar phosphate isomerase/epimerase
MMFICLTALYQYDIIFVSLYLNLKGLIIILKTGVSSYSFIRLFKDGFSIFDCVDKAVEMGFEGIEFIPFEAPKGKDSLDFASKISAYCAKKCITVTSYATGGQLICNSTEEFEAEITRLCSEVDITEALGAKKMRHDVTFGFPQGYTGIKTFEAVLPALAEGCRIVTQYAKTKGIETMVENHGMLCQDSNRILTLVTAVNDSNYGALCDIGNFTCADEAPAIAVGNVMPVVKHVHIKDMFVKDGTKPNPGEGWFCTRAGNFIRCTIAGHGDVPILQCLRIIKNSGYDGYVTLEFEGMENVLDSIKIGLNNIKNYIAML